MNLRVALLILHVLLLVLASTSLTIVTGCTDGVFHWEYFRYASQHGRGVAYEFPYTLLEVLIYVAAYAAGLGGFGLSVRAGSRLFGFAGVVLCALGLLSFAYELSHWASDHYSSWILSVPIVVLPLAVGALVQQYRQGSTQLARV